MGIYDREYYRKEGPSFLGSFTEQGKACKWLIAINVIVFVVQIVVPRVTDWLDLRVGQSNVVVTEAEAEYEAIREYGLDRLENMPPAEQQKKIEEARQHLVSLRESGVTRGQVWRLLTYAFLHDRASIWHIVFNMLFLWWFGHEMEELYGPREFTMFYLVSAFLGGVAYFLWAWARDVPAGCVGASGAVTAVMVLYAFHYPSRVIRIWWILPVPIWLFVAFQVAQDTFLFASGIPTTTAVTVHLAGAAFGFGYYKGNWRLAPIWTALTRFRLPRRNKARLRVYEEEAPTPVRRPRPATGGTATGVTEKPPAASSGVDEHLEAQVDAVLEKVARSGRDSLTESEKELLVRASEVYKRKQRP
jgi:membrane associated rhomboid family serine protease